MQTTPNMPLVSIVTPTYNHASWIGACIESVQRQTYSNWEQIIVDDGSTDGTVEAIAPYLSDTRITYIHQQNKGIWRLAETYNEALRVNRGEFVALLEGDDFWPADKLQAQLSAFADTSIGMAYGRIVIADDSGQIMPGPTRRKQQWRPPYESFADASPLPFLRDLLLLRGDVGAISVMFRRATLEAVGGFWQPDGFPAVDYTTVLRVATHSRVAFLDHPLGVWRQHTGQTTDVHGVNYALGHTAAAIAHFRSLSPVIRHELAITEQDIWAARRGYLADAHWGAVQSRLRAGDWKRARAYAWGLLRWGNAFRRVEGMAGLLAAVLHFKINPMIYWAARTRLGRSFIQGDT